MYIESVIVKIEALLKKRVKRHSRLWTILCKCKNSVIASLLLLKPPAPPLSFEKIFDLYSTRQKDLFFIQVGACDGVECDPINKFITRDKWAGILIEPVKYNFNLMVENYKSCKNLIFENIAIADLDGTKDFYSLDQKIFNKSPWWFKQFGTFKRETLLSMIPDGTEKYIVTEKVICSTLEALLKKHNVKRVDIMVIDTEGYDYEIIKLIRFDKIRPDIVMYEYTHLDIKDNNECIRYLKKNGYRLYKEKSNIMALSKPYEIL